jgi:hypothetical protein
MRHVTVILALGLAALPGSRLAFATPFEPATIPDQVQAVGHLDVDALRKTQIFAAAGGQAAIDAALDEAPPEVRPIARALSQSIRGVSFWHGGDHGALLLETRDGRLLAQLATKVPVKPTRTVDGSPVFTFGAGDHAHFAAVVGDTLVLADSNDSLDLSVHVLAGRGTNLARSNKLPLSNRQGVFVFITLGDHMLGAIQKAAHSKVLQLGLRSLVVDVGEAGGTLTANARAEMRSADAVQKAKSIVDGLQALASLHDDPAAAALLDGVTVTANGLALEVVAKLPISQLVPLIQAHHQHHGHHKHKDKDKTKAKDHHDDDDSD